MPDPLSEVIALLRPSAVFAKAISGAGPWAVRYTPFGQPSFRVVMEGRCLLSVDGQKTITLGAGDFVLLPATPAFTMTGFEAARPVHMDPRAAAGQTGEVRYGRRGVRPTCANSAATSSTTRPPLSAEDGSSGDATRSRASMFAADSAAARIVISLPITTR